MSRANHKGLELICGVLYFEGKALCNVEQILVGSQIARLEVLMSDIGGCEDPREELLHQEGDYEDGYQDGYDAGLLARKLP
jgi:hypothetical protein